MLFQAYHSTSFDNLSQKSFSLPPCKIAKSHVYGKPRSYSKTNSLGVPKISDPGVTGVQPQDDRHARSILDKWFGKPLSFS